MILPIVAYGDPVLRKQGEPIGPDYPDLPVLIANMWDTMYQANGVGLAAPQIGRAIRLFVIDASPFADDEDLPEDQREVLRNFKRVFINARIETESGLKWAFNEGCLSIPDIREDVNRMDTVTLTYQDEAFQQRTEVFGGLLARIIQHEYDHIEGILFTDKLSSFKKRLLKGKLTDISRGKIEVDYKMKFPAQKRGR
ncbi:MAG TPA: peptide deformylase [Robiginitalea sp.]|nr:peptide deformylase [Robiginitalea sp.]